MAIMDALAAYWYLIGGVVFLPAGIRLCAYAYKSTWATSPAASSDGSHTAPAIESWQVGTSELGPGLYFGISERIGWANSKLLRFGRK